ncbi:DUF2169 domain-containing protein [Caballeronia sp. LZ065]|uniref:DUF2169 family type VI secretion system accessory protein n=1 Tax=Caballeronia sp. LZ065 TaxID=3038571 RepID=UPI00285C2FF3|nr:DUF2169 domain-containing protein [Caballeronia sp. LZ065]MDR5781429.1 DUF2169 domain-containing protein [Caballeronia sp. LZ065]
MKIMKPTRLTVLTRPYRHQGNELLGVAVACMATLGDASRVLGEQTLWNTVGAELAGQTLDLGLPKRHPEYLATAWAYGVHCDDQHACEVGLRVAQSSKRLRVTGDRVSQDGRPLPAAPFERMPLDWTKAYGGADYPQNPLGLGHEASPAKLPNLAYADDLMTSSDAPVRSASFAPVPSSWPQRRELYGELDDTYLEEDFPGYPRGMDAAYFNIAPADQQFPDLSALPAACDYELVNLHSERARIAGRLPPLHVRAFAWHTNTASGREIPMRLTTLWFLPHIEKVVMIYHGVAAIRSFDASDIACLMLAAETAGHPRPAAHYEDIHTRRLDPRRGVLYAMRDGDLFPEDLAASGDSAWTPGEPNAMARQFLNRLERETQALGAPAAPAATPMPARPEQLVDYVEQTQTDADRKIANLRERADEILAAPRPPAPAEHATPPEMPEMPGAVIDPALLAMRRKTHLQSAQFRPAPPLLPGQSARAASKRAWVTQALADGLSLIEADLAGADLSNLDLSGVDLSRASLDGADLSGAIFIGACLRQANLVRAKLRGTRLSNADLSEANLSLVEGESADFREACLRQSVIEQGSFEQCDFSGATLDRTQLSKGRLGTSFFREARISNVVMMDQEIDRADFSRAIIRKFVLFRCPSQTLDFSDADIIGLGLTESPVEQRLCFKGARLHKACFLQCGALHASTFAEAELVEVNLHAADLARSDFTRARIANSDLSNADLQACTFLDARFERGYLVRADLRLASLHGADLIEALLRAADLRGADLREANLFRANLGDVLIDDATRLDDAYQERVIWCPRARPEAA